MREVRTPCVLTLMIVAATGNSLAQPGPTQSELNAASTNTTDWLMTRHGYDAQRYVDLDQIHRRNAASLRPICIYQTAFTGPFNTNPVVYQGTMYLTAGTSTMAIDATTCALKWRHEWRTRARDTNLPNNRGVALKDGKVIRGTVDAFLIALDAQTGELLWDTPAADPEIGASFTMPPLIFEDLVIIGPAGSELGVRGWVGAFSLNDGSPVWRFNLIPNTGEPGAETWSDPESELIGGGAVWTPFGFDPVEARVYIPVANPAPDFFSDIRQGDNLYTSSMVVLDARTGELQWYYQVVPHDEHDWDLTQASPLFTTEVNGQQRNMVATVGKDGLLHVLDRDTEEHMFATPVTRRENTSAPLTVEGVRACPGYQGGVEWSGPAYHPALNLLYTPAVDWCSTYMRAESFDEPDRLGTFRLIGGGVRSDPYDDARGWLTAVDASTGAIRWNYQSPQPMLASITTTSGGLLITGELTGDFVIFDAADGAELYRFNTGAPINGGNAVYAIDGTQYIAVMAGNTSSFWPTPVATGNVIVFALP